MKRDMVLCGLAALFGVLVGVSGAHPQWVPDGVLVHTSSINEGDWAPLKFGVVPDGRDGAIVFWIEHEEGVGDDIFAQRIDGRGNLLWPSGGAAVCAAEGDRTSPRVAADGAYCDPEPITGKQEDADLRAGFLARAAPAPSPALALPRESPLWPPHVEARGCWT